MTARIKVLRIYCCEDCTALGYGNSCDELERTIEDSTLEPPDECPLEEL
jgi:hypothetical protein